MIESPGLERYVWKIAMGLSPHGPAGDDEDLVAPAPGSILAGKYRVDRTLGLGGMGVVVAATHVQLDQPVAMKFLLPSMLTIPEAAPRFLREARAAVKIQSEHVARVIDVGTLEGGEPYMVMELLKGHDLAEVLRRRGPLPVGEAVRYVLEACDAIAEAHAYGIVHRDLKPSNLFLAERNDGSSTVKVLDFGISKVNVVGGAEDAALTRTATMMGSPLYMSPEQMRSARDVDPRTDIWSLGCILYELLSGRAPFLGDTIPEICMAILETTPQPFSVYRADVPPRLEAVTLRCLARQAAHRVPNVAELARILAEFAPDSRAVAERAARLLRTDAALAGTRPATPAETALPVAAISATAGAWAGAKSGAEPRRGRTALWIALGLAGAGAAFTALAFTLGSGDTAADAAASALPMQASVPAAAAPAPPVPTVQPALPEPPASAVSPEPAAQPKPAPEPKVATTQRAPIAKKPEPKPEPPKPAPAAPPKPVSATPAPAAPRNPLNIDLK